MPVEMNPDLLQWAGDEAEPGDAHDFLRRFPVGTDRRQPVAALFSAKSDFRNREEARGLAAWKAGMDPFRVRWTAERAGKTEVGRQRPEPS